MCLPITNPALSDRTNIMKAKLFATQVQSQSRAQQQLLSSTMKMINNDNTDSDTDTDVSRRVRFNNDVVVVPFEKVTIQEQGQTPNNIWYTITEMKQIKKESREIASSYRKLRTDTDTETDTDTATEYRGFENCTAIRQKQKIMSNRCVVHAYEQGFNANEIATIYSKTNKWSGEVAFLQAIHDYMNVYNKTGALAHEILPSISSMIPPQPHPFAIESVMVMQRKKKRQRAAQAQAQQLFAFQQEQQPQERSVRQRVC